MRNGWKFGVMGMLAAAGFVAGACGGGGEEGGGATAPTASQSAAPAASSAAMPAESASAMPSATASAAPPAPPPLPEEFTKANDARTGVDTKLKALLAKDGKCPELATEITKFTKENAAVWTTWNGEWAKLTDDQKKQAGVSATTDTTPAGGVKTCVDKKDKKVTAALAALTTATTKAPGAAPAAGSAAPKAGAKPKK